MVYLLIVGMVFLVDLAIKTCVDRYCRCGEAHPCLGGRVILEKYYNSGAALNLLSSAPQMMKKIHAVLLSAAAACLLWNLRRDGNKLEKTGLALLLGGGASNLYDRFRFGHVVDYFSLNTRFARLRSIIFNLSDFCVFAGAVLAAAGAMKKKKP